jgi:hypothetical protein
MTELLLRPLLEGFGVTFGDNVIRTKLDGGASRTRLDKIGSAHEVQVSWNLLAKGYDYLQAFYRTYSALPFTIKMKSVDASTLQTYTARFIGPPVLNSFRSNIYQVSATLEVTPLTVNPTTDAATITAGPV